jgi:DNA-binding transcriptional ArsR family regulator
MEQVLWYLIAGTRGGPTRVRIIRAIEERPRNANQLAEHLDVDYNTVRYHLDMLTDHDILEATGDGYGNVYFTTDRFSQHREAFEQATEAME